MPNDIATEELMAKLASTLDRIARPIPLEHALWNVDNCADYLKCQPRQFSERYSVREDFPLPVRLPTPAGSKGHPRWYAAQVIAWARKFQERD